MTAYSSYQAYPGQAPTLLEPPPVLVAVLPPQPQQRLGVFFRLILAIPHLIVLYIIGLVAAVVAFLGWWGALFTGRLPQFAVSFLSGYLRWAVRVYGYVFLLTETYPPFSLDDDPEYPVRIAIPAPQQLNRAAVFFRFILVIPAALLIGLIAYGGGTLLAFIAWLITVFTGRLPAPFHLAYTAVLRFQARYIGYYLMLTPAYPGGLYGDQPGTPTWADGLEAASAPGYGAPGGFYNPQAPGYGTPAPASAPRSTLPRRATPVPAMAARVTGHLAATGLPAGTVRLPATELPVDTETPASTVLRPGTSLATFHRPACG